MKKRLFLFALLFICIIPLRAFDFKAENDEGVIIYYNILSSTECQVARGDYSHTVNIPATVVYNNDTLSVTSIANYAFYECYYLFAVSIPNTVKEIVGSSTFESRSALKSIDVAMDNPYFSSIDGVLYNKNQTSLVVCPCGKKDSFSIPESVAKIEDGAFRYCTGLSSVIIPNSVISIGERSFYGCTNLSSIVIPSSVSSIGAFAFDDSFRLTSVTINSGLTNIEANAFVKCSALRTVRIDSETPPSCTKPFAPFKYTNGVIQLTLEVPQGCKSKYESSEVWKDFVRINEFNSSAIDLINISDIDNTSVYTLDGFIEPKQHHSHGIQIRKSKVVLIQ